ncbi:hypothetical protein ACFQ4L_00885 [Lapidilactobacillus mulanensis]|uniref:Uncharacterized protein n=1 Tax=Lapidilactobacillus mulanensis TaxID=2485999 RepID=A0ABW4DJ00_9LACO|nr:hypothetical protein [Lapidilactobacillus mulanensis]
MMFSKSQIDFMQSHQFEVHFSKKLSDQDYINIEEKASNLLQTEGFDVNYEPTELGTMCEAIIDSIE